MPNKTKCIDDTLLWSDNIEESFFQAVEWLDICGRNGIILNPEKFQFAQNSVQFAGFEITLDEVKPCKEYIESVANFPEPQNITDARSWFGLVNQVAYAVSVADIMLPFRHLLKPNMKFEMTDELKRAFQESKQLIVKEIENGIKIFDVLKPTALVTDWSKTGVGFWLLQKHCSCKNSDIFCCTDGWKTTLVGSRFTHPAESRYAPVEGEALGKVTLLYTWMQ